MKELMAPVMQTVVAPSSNVRNGSKAACPFGWKADGPGTSPLRGNGEGDRSAQLRGGGAGDGRAEAIDAVGDAIGIGKHVGCEDA